MNQETREIYGLYLRCFPGLYLDYEPFCRRLSLHSPATQRLLHREGDTLAGVCLTEPGAILLLCVDPRFRCQGIGSSLLQKAEELRREDGSLRLGLGSSYLFQGVPLLSEDMPGFFQRRGYEASWISEDLTLKNPPIPAPPCPPDIHFRPATPGDFPALLAAVAQVEPGWVQYYQAPSTPILLACRDEEILGFTLFGPTDESFSHAPGTRMAAIGCVGVLPSARQQGIGLKMVETAAAQLLEQGAQELYIGYTHLSPWYARLGFRPRLRCWMGEKGMQK